MITKQEKISLEELEKSEWWLVLKRYLNIEIQNIAKRCLSIGSNVTEYTQKDLDLVRLAELQNISNSPLTLVNTYSENKPMNIEQLNELIEEIDFEQLSQSLM